MPTTVTPAPPLARPPAATSMGINLAGLLACGGVFVLLSPTRLPDLHVAVLCMLTLVVVIGGLELLILKVHRRESTGLESGPPPPRNLPRLAVKLLGAYATFGVLALCYWMLPEYRSDFYSDFWRVLRLSAPMLIAIHFLVFAWTDRRMKEPKDAYWQVGMLLLGKTGEVQRAVVVQHALGWMIKGFFTPLMFLFLLDVLGDLRGVTLARLDTVVGACEVAFCLCFTVDLVFTTTGYLCSLRVLDSHIRSAEPTLLGWLVTLVCYRPFWDFFYQRFFEYGDSYTWEAWPSGSPLQVLWAALLIACMVVYAWATVAFGLRFSNLTHRGILTHGPYRIFKHPAYLTKNLSWWLISIPFLPAQGWEQAVRQSFMLLCVNAIYFLRAKTEERHLSRDPVYVAYALWMNDHGALRWLGRWLPALRFRPPPVPAAPGGASPPAVRP